MADSPMSEVIQRLRQGVLLRDGASLTDGQLLECFLTHREGAAVEALVRRHGPMVWGVCRRILLNHHDAEDAFQATFLVLVRRAASVVPREMVANWLYGVARQTALKARATAARRKRRERQVTEMPEPAVTDALALDLRPLLDQELSKLPGKYRLAIVLCDLEGKTRKEVARQLDLPEGTVAGQLARARRMLAQRLARQRLVLSSGMLAGLLARTAAATACVPPLVLSSTIRSATLVAACRALTAATVKPGVAALTTGVLNALFLAKVKNAVLVLVTVGVIAAGAVVFGSNAARDVQPSPKQPEPKKTVAEGQTNPAPPEPKKPGPRPRDGPRDDKVDIQGTWVTVAAEQDGKPLARPGKWVITENKIVHKADDGSVLEE